MGGQADVGMGEQTVPSTEREIQEMEGKKARRRQETAHCTSQNDQPPYRSL